MALNIRIFGPHRLFTRVSARRRQKFITTTLTPLRNFRLKLKTFTHKVDGHLGMVTKHREKSAYLRADDIQLIREGPLIPLDKSQFETGQPKLLCVSSS